MGWEVVFSLSLSIWKERWELASVKGKERQWENDVLNLNCSSMQFLETFKNKNKMTKGDTCSREIFEENVHFSSICKI